MVEQQYLLFLGSALIMFGLFIIMFSIRPKQNGSTGIMLLGPIPIVWGGKSKLVFLIPLLFVLMIMLVLLL
ncbi:MAG TPA: DUF131 domain-containing protein [Nitrososphaerales archaeon]|nr:DUF131 domain-containing protein [Nitrososphaerales archaeon]